MSGDNCLTQDEGKKIEDRLDEILSEIKKIHGGFPRTEYGDVDFVGHREAHEAMIKAAKAQENFWNELKLDIAKKGVWGMLIILVGLVLTGAAAKFGLAEINHIK